MDTGLMMLTGLVLSIQMQAAPCPDALAGAKLTLLYFADIMDPRRDMLRHYTNTYTARPAVSVGPDHNFPAAPRGQEQRGWECQ